MPSASADFPRLIKRTADLAVGIELLLKGFPDAVAGDRLDLLAHVIQIGLTGHFLKAPLKLARDRAGLADPLTDGAHHARQVLGADDNHRHQRHQEEFLPT